MASLHLVLHQIIKLQMERRALLIKLTMPFLPNILDILFCNSFDMMILSNKGGVQLLISDTLVVKRHLQQ